MPLTAIPVNLFAAQYAATLFMTGLIWFVQIVHYPLFATIYKVTSAAGFRDFQAQHATRTGWVVFPPMSVELMAALASLFPALRPAFVSRHAATASAILVLLIWASTGLVQVPLHNRLSSNPDHSTIGRLVISNWLRTLLWSARSVLLSSAFLHLH